MRRSGALLVAAILAAVTTSACTRVVTARGPVVGYAFRLAPFDALVVAGAFTVRVTQGPRQTVTLRANRDVVPDVNIQSTQSVLHVTVQPRLELRKATLELNVVAPRLGVLDASSSARVTFSNALSPGRLDVSAGGDSRVDGLVRTGTLNVEADDGSSVRLSGTAEDVTVDAESSAHVDVAGVRASDAEVHLTRESTAAVAASDRLKVDLSRSSHLTYSGSPALEQPKVVDGSTLARA